MSKSKMPIGVKSVKCTVAHLYAINININNCLTRVCKVGKTNEKLARNMTKLQRHQKKEDCICNVQSTIRMVSVSFSLLC